METLDNLTDELGIADSAINASSDTVELLHKYSGLYGALRSGVCQTLTKIVSAKLELVFLHDSVPQEFCELALGLRKEIESLPSTEEAKLSNLLMTVTDLLDRSNQHLGSETRAYEINKLMDNLREASVNRAYSCYCDNLHASNWIAKITTYLNLDDLMLLDMKVNKFIKKFIDYV